MEISSALAFARANPRAVLATSRRDGRPQLSPVLVAGAADGRLHVSTRETAVKVRNVERDPRVSVCLLDDGFFGAWVGVDGTASVVHLPEAMELLVDYYRAISGEHPDWDDYRAAMERERRVILAIDVTRAGPDVSG